MKPKESLKTLHTVTARVEQFPGNSPWFFIRIPQSILEHGKTFGGWSSIKVTYYIGESSHTTSVFPMGKWAPGKKFLPIKASIRKKENIYIGDEITVYIEFI